MAMVGSTATIVVALSIALLAQFRATSNEIRIASEVAMEKNLQTQLERRGVTITEFLAENLVNPVIGYDMDLIQQLIESTLSQADVKYVYVLDADGKVLHDGELLIPNFGKALNDPLAEKAAVGRELVIQRSLSTVDISAPVQTGDTVFGRVRVGLSARAISADIASMSVELDHISRTGIDENLKLVQVTSVLLLLIGIAMAVFFSRRFTRPVRDLTIGVEQIARGALDTRVPEHGDDELGRLAKAFNNMVSQVKDMKEDLETHALALETEIEEREALDARLRQAEKMDAIGQLAGGVAHDFNNQLTVIQAHVELLSKRVVEPEHLELLDTIESSAASASELTQQLLAFARKGTFRFVEVDLHVTIADVTTMLSRGLDKRVVIESRLEANRSIVPGDPAQLQNALLNLGLNANDAMETGGELRFETAVTSIDADSCGGLDGEIRVGEYLQVSVVDTGKGIIDEIFEHIFDPFFTTKDVGQGTGLGLAAVYGTVHRHGGFIRVERAQDTTSFILHLPLNVENAQPAEQSGMVELPSGDFTVLVVDDERLVRVAISNLLQNIDCKAVLAESGNEALKLYAEQQADIDVVLLDLMMPEKSGEETFHELRAFDPGVPIVIASGYSIESQTEWIAESDNTATLQKPFRMEQLRSVLAKLLD